MTVPSLSASGLASLVTALGFIGFLTIGSVTQLASVPFGLWWCELFLFFGVPFVALRFAGKDALLTTGFTRPWVAGCLFGFALGFANFFAAVAPIQFIAQKLAPQSLLDVYDASKVFQDKSPLELAVIIGGVCIAAPIAEEFFFRGALQRGWGERMGPVAAIVLTGAVFSAFHLDPIGFAARWELGVLFGLLAWRTGSLWPGIFAHLANNLTSTCLYFALKDQPQDPTEDVTAILAIAGLGGLVLLAVLFAGRQFGGALQSPRPAVDTPSPHASPLLALSWMATGLTAIVVLLLVDFKGSMVRAIDMMMPVKNPPPQLKVERQAVLDGEQTYSGYFAARKNAKPRPADAGE